MLEGSRHWEDFAKGSCLLRGLLRVWRLVVTLRWCFFCRRLCCLELLPLSPSPGTWCQGMDASMPALKA